MPAPSACGTSPAAAAIVAACTGKPGEVSEEAKPSTQLSPLLFDLTSLQREANGKFGFSAKTTLSIAQALYEKHKVLTYPRTDARALPEDYLGVVKKTMEELGALSAYKPYTKQALKAGWIRPNKRVFDNSKISDHFAIIPTPQTPGHLSEVEAKLYDLVAKRFLAVFFPAAEYLVTTRITRVEGHAFKTEGKVLVEPGWLAIYGREAVEEQGSLVKVDEGERVRTTEIESVPLATRPPPRYTEATLLTAMEGAGKLIEDDELRAAMAGKGLGTPATRAQIIENLIDQRYMVRDGRDLRPTRKAFDLMTLLKGLDVPELTAPELTGEWEFKLSQMERGKLKRDLFMREIAGMTQKIVQRAKSYESDTVPIEDPAQLTKPCPKCGKTVIENYRRFACTSCDFSIPKHPGSRSLEVEEVEELLDKGTIGPMSGFISKMGRPFSAVLKLTPEYKLEFDFGQGSDDGASDEAVDFTGQQAARSLPEMRRSCIRAADELPVRTRDRPGEDLRFPFGQGDPAAADRARADGKAAQRGPHRHPARASCPTARGASSMLSWCASPMARSGSSSSRAPRSRRARRRHGQRVSRHRRTPRHRLCARPFALPPAMGMRHRPKASRRRLRPGAPAPPHGRARSPWPSAPPRRPPESLPSRPSQPSRQGRPQVR